MRRQQFCSARNKILSISKQTMKHTPVGHSLFRRAAIRVSVKEKRETEGWIIWKQLQAGYMVENSAGNKCARLSIKQLLKISIRGHTQRRTTTRSSSVSERWAQLWSPYWGVVRYPIYIYITQKARKKRTALLQLCKLYLSDLTFFRITVETHILIYVCAFTPINIHTLLLWAHLKD
jgi:hypothetical protein